MGLSPKFRGGPRRARRVDADESAAAPAERAKRPVPERTGPRRSGDGLFRQDPPSAATTAPEVTPQNPVEEGVHAAYQVFDRYLDEGRAFAAGQSAWYQNDTGQPELTRDIARAAADLLGLLGRIAKEGNDNPSGYLPNAPNASALTELAKLANAIPTDGTDALTKDVREQPFHPQQAAAYPHAHDEWEPVELDPPSNGAPPTPVLSEPQAKAVIDAAPEVAAAVAQTAQNLGGLGDLRPDELAPLDPADRLTHATPQRHD